METWKDIPGYEGCYQVSDFGRVKSLARHYGNSQKKEMIMKQYIDHWGYFRVRLYKSSVWKIFRVHNLVLLSFKGERPSGCTQTRHLNGNPADNRPDNLAYGTSLDNHNDAVRHGTFRRVLVPRGEKHPSAKLTQEQVMIIMQRPESGRALAKEYGVNPSTIQDIRKGRKWRWLTASALMASVMCGSCSPYASDNMMLGGAAGCAIGFIAGPTGCIIGSSAGAFVGASSTPPPPEYSYSYAPPSYAPPQPDYAPPPDYAPYTQPPVYTPPPSDQYLAPVEPPTGPPQPLTPPPSNW